MEMIRTSKKHCCVRKLYALQKDGLRHLEAEFVPCVAYTELEEKDRVSFDYCQWKIHKLPYYPARNTRSASCQTAKQLLKDFINTTHSEVLFYKGGTFEKKISTEIGVESFNIEELGVKKVNTHNPKEEVHLHHSTIKWMSN